MAVTRHSEISRIGPDEEVFFSLSCVRVLGCPLHVCIRACMRDGWCALSLRVQPEFFLTPSASRAAGYHSFLALWESLPAGSGVLRTYARLDFCLFVRCGESMGFGTAVLLALRVLVVLVAMAVIGLGAWGMLSLYTVGKDARDWV